MKIRFLGSVDSGGLGKAYLRVTPLSCFFIFFLKNVFFFIVFLSNMFHCWHLYQSLTVNVSSVVGAPWRCGILTTLGGIAGIGLGHLLGREHDSTPRVEWRLLRGLSRLQCCCCCCCSGRCIMRVYAHSTSRMHKLIQDVQAWRRGPVLPQWHQPTPVLFCTETKPCPAGFIASS